MENNEQVKVNQEEREPHGWRDVVITPDMPVTAIVQFFNILNQRLCTIEDGFQVEMEDGSKLTITELYRMQAEMEEKAQKGE